MGHTSFLQKFDAILWEARCRCEQVLGGLGEQTESAVLAGETTAHTLSLWHCPEQMVVGSLVLAVSEAQGIAPERAACLFKGGAEVVPLTERALLWRRRLGLVSADLAEEAPAHYLSLLRGLCREAYLDAPEQRLLLLLLARHSQLLQESGTLSRPLAQLTVSVFVPLTQLLGVWQLRRDWLEKSMAALYPDEYQQMQAQLGTPELHDRQRWLRWYHAEGPAPTQANPRLVVKAEAYCRLEEELTRSFERENLSPCPRLFPIPIFAGVSLRRVQYGESRERVVRWLRVRVLCHSEADCYRALGVIHRLGEPVTFKFSEHFADFLAAPKPNGYRALRTAIYYRAGGAAGAGGGVAVEFRILTPSCHLVNEQGVIAAVYKRPKKRAEPQRHCWWARSDLGEIQARLAARDIGSRPEADSEQVYVFTPQGEVRVLPNGSTALDFAYDIHSELGNHARKIKVNGEVIDYNHRLHNGDLVEVHHDPRFHGPDLAWGASVTTDRAKRRIQQEGKLKAHSAHRGRARIEERLLDVLRWYRQQRHYEFRISSGRLDALLLKAAQARGYGNLLALYDDIERRGSADDLVEELLSAELAPLLRTPGNRPPDCPQEAIRLCSRCRPVPRDRVVGLRHCWRNAFWLTVHREQSRPCLGSSSPARRLPLVWLDDPPGKEQMVLQIEAEDRRGLLGEVLRVVYDQPSVSLCKVAAVVPGEFCANLSLILEADALSDFAVVRERLEKLEGIRSLSFIPPSPAQRVLRPRGQSRVVNPYSYDYDLDRSMFYDREDLLEYLLGWVRADSPTHRLLLWGPKRVGKTCLAQYFARHVLPPLHLALPVYVDFRGMTRFDPESLVDFLGGKILAGRGHSQLAAARPGSAVERLSDLLKQVADHLPSGQRLLVILDEINFFMDVPESRFDPTALNNLGYLIASRPEVCWLLIAQPLPDSNHPRAAHLSKLLVEFPRLEVPNLGPNWAEKLILEPVRRCGMSYARSSGQAASSDDQSPVPARLIELTDGNPYLIQVCCSKLIEHVCAQKQTVITTSDLERVVRDLLAYKDESYFSYVTRPLRPLQRTLLALLARFDAAGVGVAPLLRQVRERSPRVDDNELEEAIKGLQRHKLVAARGTGGEGGLRITMGLLRQWARIHLEP